MPPTAAKSAQMSRVRSAHTAPEMVIRRELHRRGLRYRVNMPLPEIGRIRPDIVFTRAQVAVFVDGCFWHRCPEHGSSPKSNADWWCRKLDTNVERDRKTDNLLAEAGWTVIRIWEHEDAATAADRVETIVCNT
nr:very short patch repair endonuclease [bacterium]